MKFPQYSKLFADYLIGAVALAAACVFCLFFMLRDGEVGISILLSVVAIGNFVGMLLGWRAEKQKEICIDETGISLTKKESRNGYCGGTRFSGLPTALRSVIEAFSSYRKNSRRWIC